MPTHENPGPYVRSAALCKSVTTDLTGQVTGLVDLMDRIMVSANKPGAPMPPFRAEMKAVVQLMAGVARGKRVLLKFETRDQSGSRQTAGS